MYASFTLLLTFLALTACGAKSTGGSAASILPTGASTGSATIVAAASQSSIVPGSTTTLSVIGGTAPYNWSVASGGTLSSPSGPSVIFTASNSPGLVYVTVTDAAGASAMVTVNVVSSTTTTTPAGNVCMGNYALMLGTTPAAAQFTTSGTTLTGFILFANRQYPLVGTCTPTGVNFTLTETKDAFTGTFVASSAARNTITGSYLNYYYKSTQTWTATPQ